MGNYQRLGPRISLGLSEPVGGYVDVIHAFNSVVATNPVQVIDSGAVVQTVADENSIWSDWAATIRSRYQL